MGVTVPVIAPARFESRIRRAVPWLAGVGAVVATLAAAYWDYQSRADAAFLVALTTGIFLGTGLLLIAQHRRGDGALALLAGLLLVPQGLTVPFAAMADGGPVPLALPDTGWTRPLGLAFVVPVVALVLRVPHGRLGIPERGLIGVLAAVLVVAPAMAVAAGSSAPTSAEGAVTVLALTSAAGVVAGALLRGGPVSRQAHVPLLVVTVGMLLAAALQVYGEMFSDGPTPPPWIAVLGLEGPRDVRDFCAAMVPVALVADAIRRAEAHADIGRRVVAGARAGGVAGIRAALRSGLLEPEIDLLPPLATDRNVPAVPSRLDRRRIPLSSHDGTPLAVVELPPRDADPLFVDAALVDAALAAARVGLEHADAVERLRTRIGELEASRAEFVTTVERERRRLKVQLSAGLREPLHGLVTLLADASGELARGDEDTARRLLVAARARLTVAHADLRLLARGVYPAVLSQSGLAVALRALAEEAEGRLSVVVSPSVEARRRGAVVEAAAYFVVATLPVTSRAPLNVTVAADPAPDGEGIKLTLAGAVPELGAVTASEEARRVAALGGVIEHNGAHGIVVRVPADPRVTGAATVAVGAS
jgi:hypothetical protein